MSESIKIIYAANPEDADWNTIGGGIHTYNIQQAGEDHGQQMCFRLMDGENTHLGGLIGATYWDWLYIDLLWIREDLRGKGYGKQLMLLAEEEARKRGAKQAYLDTFSFQVPGFYEQLGYHVYGELKDFPKGHIRYFFTKSL